jgi:hypothetical protein
MHRSAGANDIASTKTTVGRYPAAFVVGIRERNLAETGSKQVENFLIFGST